MWSLLKIGPKAAPTETRLVFTGIRTIWRTAISIAERFHRLAHQLADGSCGKLWVANVGTSRTPAGGSVPRGSKLSPFRSYSHSSENTWSEVRGAVMEYSYCNKKPNNIRPIVSGGHEIGLMALDFAVRSHFWTKTFPVA